MFSDPLILGHKENLIVEVILPPSQNHGSQTMLDGSVDHTLETGFTKHKILGNQFQLRNLANFKLPRLPKDGRIILATSGVFWAKKFRFLLPTGGLPLGKQPVFQFRIFVSGNGIIWNRICDNSERPRRGWQTVEFDERPIGKSTTLHQGHGFNC